MRKQRLFIDQWGNHYWARTVRELRKKIDGGGCRVSKMYAEGIDGKTYHVGYVIGRYWLNAYEPMRIPS